MIDGIKTLLDYFKNERLHRSDLRDAALMAICTSSTETLIYLSRLERGKQRDREAEEELARLWHKAAVPIRHFSVDLADRCLYKSEYWISPEEWTKDDVAKNRIGITRVRNEARALLKEK
jgi:hypothetical protein